MTTPVRPRDAASLVLYRMRNGVPEVLVGLRHRRHKFMPETWVFPGGRVDPGDYGVAVATDLREEVAARLMRHTTRARAKALAVAAVRETYEEAGLMLGAPASPPKGPVGEHWRGFLDRGLAPALDALDVLARAITPTGSHRRFNTRFFLAEGSRAVGEARASGEFDELNWLAVDEARRLPLVDITLTVLETAIERVRTRRLGLGPVPLYCYRGDRRLVLAR